MARQAAAVFTGVFRVKRCNMMLTVVKIVSGAGTCIGKVCRPLLGVCKKNGETFVYYSTKHYLCTTITNSNTA